MLNQIKLLFALALGNKFIRYALVGVSSLAIDSILIVFFVEVFGMYPPNAKIPSQIVAISNSFYWNRRWTFKNKSQRIARQVTIFFVVTLLGALIGQFVFTFFIEFLRIHYIISNFLTAFITILWNFNVNKTITFRDAN